MYILRWLEILAIVSAEKRENGFLFYISGDQIMSEKVYNIKYEMWCYLGGSPCPWYPWVLYSSTCLSIAGSLLFNNTCLREGILPNYSNFLDCVQNDSVLYSQFNTFRSYNHKIFTITQNKLALTNYDDKRYIMDDGINSLAYGQHKL